MYFRQMSSLCTSVYSFFPLSVSYLLSGSSFIGLSIIQILFLVVVTINSHVCSFYIKESINEIFLLSIPVHSIVPTSLLLENICSTTSSINMLVRLLGKMSQVILKSHVDDIVSLRSKFYIESHSDYINIFLYISLQVQSHLFIFFQMYRFIILYLFDERLFVLLGNPVQTGNTRFQTRSFTNLLTIRESVQLIVWV